MCLGRKRAFKRKISNLEQSTVGQRNTGKYLSVQRTLSLRRWGQGESGVVGRFVGKQIKDGENLNVQEKR